MMSFWPLALAMAGGAMAFVLWPVFRGRRESAARSLRARSNLAVFDDRLAELTAERDEGRLTAAEFESLRTELERALLRDVDPDEVDAPTATVTVTSGRALLLVSAIAAPLLALVLYADWGLSFGAQGELALADDVRLLDLSAEEGATDEALGALAERLEARLAREGGNPDDWFLLGRTTLRLGAYDRAADAFARVDELTGGALVAGVFRAQALYLADARELTPRVRAAIDGVLARAPGQPIMLELLAMDAFRGQRYAEAADYFAQVLRSDVGDPERRRFLVDGLTRARELAGLPPLPFAGAAPTADVPAGAGTAAVSVSVTVPDSLLATLPASARLFVLARAAGGGMPLAVERHAPASRTELTLTVDDAMSPAVSIATAETVQIVARLSLSGTAARSDGDLEAVAEAVPTTAGARVMLALGEDAAAPVVLAPAAPPGVRSPGAEETPASAAEAGASIRVLVELDDGLRAPAGAMLYVFARAPEGPAMPLAVTRLAASELPALVTLSDAQAMVPGQGLSSVPEVELVARVTAAGGVRGESGDLEGLAGPLVPGDSDRVVSLLIDRVLP